MTGLGALYLQKHVPEIATIFTTHATTIGRSIAGNNKPLYDYLFAYNGDQMSRELNVESKHSIEKQTAHHVDCVINKPQELRWSDNAHVINVTGGSVDVYGKSATPTSEEKSVSDGARATASACCSVSV